MISREAETAGAEATGSAEEESTGIATNAMRARSALENGAAETRMMHRGYPIRGYWYRAEDRCAAGVFPVDLSMQARCKICVDWVVCAESSEVPM